MTAIPKGQEITDQITKHMDRRFFSSIDLVGQGVVTLTIKRVEKLAVLKYENGRTDKNVILAYFNEISRPLKLCVTNIRRIVDIVGTTKVSDWTGKKIPFHAEIVKVKGVERPAVRVVEKK